MHRRPRRQTPLRFARALRHLLASVPTIQQGRFLGGGAADNFRASGPPEKIPPEIHWLVFPKSPGPVPEVGFRLHKALFGQEKSVSQVCPLKKG